MRSLFTPFIRCTTRANPATDSRRPGPVHRALLSRFQSATDTWIDETERITVTMKAGDGPEDVVVCVFSLTATQRLHELLPGDVITVIGTYDDVAASGPLFGRVPGLSSCRPVE